MASKEISEVSLVNGEKVQVQISSNTLSKTNFMRMGKKLLMSIDSSMPGHNVYFWKEVDEVYRHLGYILFEEQEDGTVIWEVHPWAHHSPKCDKKATLFLAKECESYLATLGRNDMSIRLLSVPHGVDL